MFVRSFTKSSRNRQKEATNVYRTAGQDRPLSSVVLASHGSPLLLFAELFATASAASKWQYSRVELAKVLVVNAANPLSNLHPIEWRAAP